MRTLRREQSLGNMFSAFLEVKILSGHIWSKGKQEREEKERKKGGRERENSGWDPFFKREASYHVTEGLGNI